MTRCYFFVCLRVSSVINDDRTFNGVYIKVITNAALSSCYTTFNMKTIYVTSIFVITTFVVFSSSQQLDVKVGPFGLDAELGLSGAAKFQVNRFQCVNQIDEALRYRLQRKCLNGKLNSTETTKNFREVFTQLSSKVQTVLEYDVSKNMLFFILLDLFCSFLNGLLRARRSF